MAWERGVEEVLFNKVVQRFQRGVSTLGLARSLWLGRRGTCDGGHDKVLELHRA